MYNIAKWNGISLLLLLLLFFYSVRSSVRLFYVQHTFVVFFLLADGRKAVCWNTTYITPSQKSQKLDNLARCLFVIQIKMIHYVCVCVLRCVAYFIYSNLMLLCYFIFAFLLILCQMRRKKAKNTRVFIVFFYRRHCH